MPGKAHLRQRHGSDALRLERFDRESIGEIDEEAISSEPNTPMYGRSRPQSPRRNKAARPLHTRSTSSSYLSPRLPAQTFEQQQHNRGVSPYQPSIKLPSGATTPSLEASNAMGQSPIVSYPPAPATWSNMPNKGQLAILALSRFVDFFQVAALQTYMVHQLKSFDPELPDSVISHQAGVLLGSFTAAQIITSILWGRAADQPGIGRKMVLNIGLVGTGITMLGVGFSKTYQQAVFWRVLGGAINGTVGSARTMVAECTSKPWHPRAFLLLPAAFNFANVLGPILGGMLVEPVKSHPGLFGPNSTFGGATGVLWMEKYPYALANLLSSTLLWAEAVLVYFFLKETLKGHRAMEVTSFDPVRAINSIVDGFRGIKAKSAHMMSETAVLKRGLLSQQEDTEIELEELEGNEKGAERPPQILPFRRIWTTNVIWTLVSVAIFDFHMGAFSNLWILFLSTAREYVPENNDLLSDFPPSEPFRDEHGDHGADFGSRLLHHLVRRSPFDSHNIARSVFKFSGGLAFPPPTIGFAMAIIGFIGIGLQFLLYPYVNGKFGLMRCFRFSLFLFPLAYFLAPYIALLPSATPGPEPASGFWVWLGISAVLTLQVAARTFALPASIILVNNSSPHPSVLATIHGLGQADSATFRTLGPMLSGLWYGTWLERGVVGMAWWIVASVSALGCIASFYVRNGSGHEIFLPGEEDAAATAAADEGQGAGSSRGPPA